MHAPTNRPPLLPPWIASFGEDVYFFSITKLEWMEMGGIYAVACIRGGGEYGKAWHQAAVKLNRPKAYEDFKRNQS